MVNPPSPTNATNCLSGNAICAAIAYGRLQIKITETNGIEQAKKIIESIADDIATNIRYEIKKNGHRDNFEESLKIFNSASNEMGFMSTLYKEDDSTFSLIIRNCILHKVAVSHQDVICHGFHDKIMMKSLDSEKKPNINVELRECIARR